MDNFFEILIYLFIIVTFINSFLKKKKKEQDKADASQKAQTERQQIELKNSKQEPSGKDILDEIQNLFNPPSNKTNEEPKPAFEDLWKTETNEDHYKETEYHEPIPAEHEATVSEHTPSFSEHYLSPEEHSPPKVELPEQTVVKRLLNNLDDQKGNYETREPNEVLLLLRDSLRNKESLKRYVVISEILGKPKALRR